MVGWHRRLDGPEFEQAPGVGDGQGSLACCSPWGRKESDVTERLNGTSHKVMGLLGCCYPPTPNPCSPTTTKGGPIITVISGILFHQHYAYVFQFPTGNYFFFKKKIKILIEILLIYKVSISAVQQSDSVINIYTHSFFHILFYYGLSQDIELFPLQLSR